MNSNPVDDPTRARGAEDRARDAEDRSVSLGRAHVQGLVFALAALAVVGLPFVLLHPGGGMRAVGIIADHGLAAVGLLLLGVVAHEALHAAAWRLGGAPAGSVRFGFHARTLTPYAHCDAPMTARAYRWAAAAPGLVLGVVPVLVALVTGSAAWWAFGVFFTVAAAGDAVILWVLRGTAPRRLVRDHPSRAGCLVLPRGEA